MHAALALALAALAAPPQACTDRARALAWLSAAHGEAPVAAVAGPDGRVLELLASPAGGWTLIRSAPNGRACLVASGRFAPAPPGPRA